MLHLIGDIDATGAFWAGQLRRKHARFLMKPGIQQYASCGPQDQGPQQVHERHEGQHSPCAKQLQGRPVRATPVICRCYRAYGETCLPSLSTGQFKLHINILRLGHCVGQAASMARRKATLDRRQGQAPAWATARPSRQKRTCAVVVADPSFAFLSPKQFGNNPNL